MDSSTSEYGPTQICYSHKTIVQVLDSGYWYELCHEINKSFKDGSLKEGLQYYAWLYKSQEIYLALKVNNYFRRTVDAWCRIYYDGYAPSYQNVKTALDEVDISLVSQYNQSTLLGGNSF